MSSRQHSKQITTLNQDLADEAVRLRLQATKIRPGFERDRLIRSARQAETALRINDWLNSAGLQTPE
jgi:hypothetical protein